MADFRIELNLVCCMQRHLDSGLERSDVLRFYGKVEVDPIGYDISRHQRRTRT